MPLLAVGLVAIAVPPLAQQFYLREVSRSPMDWLILSLGLILFLLQLLLTRRALRWHGTDFDDRPDRWLSNLAQAAEWFPMLGLIGTVAGILQTFGSISGPITPEEVIQKYAPAITATGSGLLMALANILPTWVVLLGRDLIRLLGSGSSVPSGEIEP